MFNDWTLDRDFDRLKETYTNDKDPFWDPPEARLIGTAVLYLDSLSFLLEIEETTPIIDFKGKQVGELTCEIIALSIGKKNLIDNFEEMQLNNFIGSDLRLEVRERESSMPESSMSKEQRGCCCGCCCGCC